MVAELTLLPKAFALGGIMRGSRDASFLENLYKDWSERMNANPDLPITELRAMFDEWGKPAREPADVTYRSETGIRPVKAAV